MQFHALDKEKNIHSGRGWGGLANTNKQTHDTWESK